jgi:hypothetical protein
MRFARLPLLACGLLLANAGGGWAQAPPITLPIPTSPGPTTPPPVTTTPAPASSPVPSVSPPLPASASPAGGPVTPLSPTPSAPTGGPLPPTTQETPLPGSAGTSGMAQPSMYDPDQLYYTADTTEETTQGTVIGRGNVQINYKGYVLTGNQAELDTNRGIATFSGPVHLVAPNGQIADVGPDGRLRVNLNRGTYTLTGTRSVIQPEQIQAQIGLIQPVYVYGGTVRGRPGFIDIRNGQFTTCDFPDPHYSFGARQAYIIPGRRLVGRNVSFYRKGHRVFSIPYLFLPLDQRLARQTLFPTVGQTPDEGYFIKFAFGYALAAALPGILRLEEFQKKGTGLGFDQSYGTSDRPTRGSGQFTIYNLYDKSRGVDDLNGSLNHTQRLGTVNATLNTQFQQNSYFAGLSKSQSQNTTLGLTRNVGNLSTSLLTTLTQNSFGFGRSQTLTSSLDNTYQPTGSSQLETRFDFSQFTSPGFAGGGGDSRQELDSNLDYRNRGKLFDLEVLATKYTQLASSSSSRFFGGLERLPEFRLATDALRSSLLRRFLPKTTRMDLSLGAFNEPSSLTKSQRARFNLDLGTTTQKITGRSTLDYGGSFQQGVYGDNTAQYVLNGQSAYRLRVGNKSTLGATYTYLRPYGYTPFQFDYTGNTNLAGLNLAVQESRAFQLAVGTGYDFNRLKSTPGFRATPFQTVSAQALYTPFQALRFRTTLSYDLNNSRLLDLTNFLRIRGSDLLALDLSGRFSPDLHRYTTINGNLNLPFFRDRREDAGYRLRAIAGYNGITSRFDYKGLAVTRSWHDYELNLTYQDTPNGLRPGSTFNLTFRLKAFPAYEPFATGQYGQALDTGIGETL